MLNVYIKLLFHWELKYLMRTVKVAILQQDICLQESSVLKLPFSLYASVFVSVWVCVGVCAGVCVCEKLY